MAILPKIEEHEASLEVQEVYKKVKARYGGFLPDIYKAFSNDPEYLDSLNDHMARVLKPRKVVRKRRRSSPWWSQPSTTATSASTRMRGRCGASSATTTRGSQRSSGRPPFGPRVTRFNIAAGVTWPETQRGPKETADAA